MFTYISVRRRLDSPTKAPLELVRQLTDTDPRVTNLQREVNISHKQIKAKYRFIKRVLEKERQEHNKLKKQLKNKQRSLENTVHNTYRKDCEL